MVPAAVVERDKGDARLDQPAGQEGSLPQAIAAEPFAGLCGLAVDVEGLLGIFREYERIALIVKLVAGGVDVVACSLPEARALIDAGKVRPLVVMDANPSALYPDVPTLKKEIGSDWKVPAFRVVGGPLGLPSGVQQRLGAALKKAHASKEFHDFMAQRGFNVSWAEGADTARMMAAIDADMGVLMKAVGLAR
jgi:tripartite-type tricarboxylate transporter receptor subunit TctC